MAKDIKLEYYVQTQLIEITYNSLSEEQKNEIRAYILSYLEYDIKDIDRNITILNNIYPKVNFEALSKLYSPKFKKQYIFLLAINLEIKNLINEKKQIKQYIKK